MNIVDYLQSERSVEFIVNRIAENLELYRGVDTEQKVFSFSGVLYNYFVNECVMNNQYLAFSKDDYSRVRGIYIALINDLRNLSSGDIPMSDIGTIVRDHRRRLIGLLSAKQSMVDVIVPCAEYSPGFQKKILRVDGDSLMQPVMDIGCGQKASLVKELRKDGVKAFGIDQYISTDKHITCESWMDFKFNDSTWGTILAHMSFSNHLRRCITFNDADLPRYKEKYSEILGSLRHRGSFIYCPSLPEIEAGIDRQKYNVAYYANNDDELLNTVYVTSI
ncbi:MAG: hypothetical protein CVV47_03940 [Spirochaetae bacterium HGW-Spirochaetae-3]|jgi:hypothetical protein|nr:MAG: hypothetical protein CVV47_03940 [Spirochaetae bacterium HGW-Spirochaetae-3]